MFLYLFDHGGSELFCIDSPDLVSSTQLESWLNTLEAATNASIHVIYVACHSGSFIDELSKTGRVITSSCRPEQSSYVSVDGKWEAFSQPFWSKIRSGHSVGWSFNFACDVVNTTIGSFQIPLLDDNGDDTGHTGYPDPLPNSGDGYLASSLFIGHCEWVYPWISYVTAKSFYAWPPPDTVTLWAKVENKTSLVNVTAWMLPPDWTPPSPDTELVEVPIEPFEMTDVEGDGNWTVNIPKINFTRHATGPSVFKFFITAEQENEMTTIPLVTGAEFTETGQPSDDNTAPRVHIERPIERRTIRGTISINGTATDDVCLQRVEFYLEGILVGNISVPHTSNSFFELDFNTRTISNGDKTILVRAFDTSGNNGIQTLTVMVDNPTLPVGGIYIPVNELELLAPYIALASAILVATAATAIYIKHTKHRKKKQ